MYYNTKESGDRIRQLRIKNGFTQECIAAALNVDRSFYSRIEAGKKVLLLTCSYSFPPCSTYRWII